MLGVVCNINDPNGFKWKGKSLMSLPCMNWKLEEDESMLAIWLWSSPCSGEGELGKMMMMSTKRSSRWWRSSLLAIRFGGEMEKEEG
ncbi:hypothetical protein MRB53_028347 [Persea americana]|uniref:Uncharacterized protein n=1 Tax=Persea americana TaxID=3435 RepID=A0ACC2KFI5_PERAE|nr:hypothetical protein MRB53_028347 [Persea americana]